MRVLVSGATGCVGRAVVRALRGRGHEVIEGARGLADAPWTLAVDYARPTSPGDWARRLSERRVEAVVNCVGILMPSAAQGFDRVHTEGPLELFRGALLAGVRRVVQVSALGVGDSPEALASPYLCSKLRADDALAALPLEWAVVRPALLYGPGSQSAALFATLASLPVIGLPGRGRQVVQPLHVYELAEAVVRLVEQAEAPQAVFELAGASRLDYRGMLAGHRRALGLGAALWLPVPMPLMRLAARFAEWLPQQVYCRDTLALLERGQVPVHNAAAELLGRAPSTWSHGLAITPPVPWVDLRVRIGAAPTGAMRAALAAMWIWTACVSLLLPGASGLLDLLHHCGFEGQAAQAAMLFSCILNLGLGVLAWRGTSPWTWALQAGAVCAYTLVAALGMPGLLVDHCGPLVKNLPVLASIVVLWLAAPVREVEPVDAAEARGRRGR